LSANQYETERLCARRWNHVSINGRCQELFAAVSCLVRRQEARAVQDEVTEL